MDSEKQNKKSSNFPKIIAIVVGILVIVLVGLILIAWWWYTNYYKDSWYDPAKLGLPRQTAISIPNKSASPISELDQSNSRLYHNTKYGYSLRYPNTWSGEGTTTNSSFVAFYVGDEMNSDVIVSISATEMIKQYNNIYDWSEEQPVGDPEGAETKVNTTYFTHNGHEVSKSYVKGIDMVNYYWICGNNIITLSYSGLEYEKYLPTFEAMFITLIPCAG